MKQYTTATILLFFPLFFTLQAMDSIISPSQETVNHEFVKDSLTKLAHNNKNVIVPSDINSPGLGNDESFLSAYINSFKTNSLEKEHIGLYIQTWLVLIAQKNSEIEISQAWLKSKIIELFETKERAQKELGDIFIESLFDANLESPDSTKRYNHAKTMTAYISQLVNDIKQNSEAKNTIKSKKNRVEEQINALQEKIKKYKEQKKQLINQTNDKILWATIFTILKKQDASFVKDKGEELNKLMLEKTDNVIALKKEQLELDNAKNSNDQATLSEKRKSLKEKITLAEQELNSIKKEYQNHTLLLEKIDKEGTTVGNLKRYWWK